MERYNDLRTWLTSDVNDSSGPLYKTWDINQELLEALVEFSEASTYLSPLDNFYRLNILNEVNRLLQNELKIYKTIESAGLLYQALTEAYMPDGVPVPSVSTTDSDKKYQDMWEAEKNKNCETQLCLIKRRALDRTAVVEKTGKDISAARSKSKVNILKSLVFPFVQWSQTSKKTLAELKSEFENVQKIIYCVMIENIDYNKLSDQVNREGFEWSRELQKLFAERQRLNLEMKTTNQLSFAKITDLKDELYRNQRNIDEIKNKKKNVIEDKKEKILQSVTQDKIIEIEIKSKSKNNYEVKEEPLNSSGKSRILAAVKIGQDMYVPFGTDMWTDYANIDEVPYGYALRGVPSNKVKEIGEHLKLRSTYVFNVIDAFSDTDFKEKVNQKISKLFQSINFTSDYKNCSQDDFKKIFGEFLTQESVNKMVTECEEISDKYGFKSLGEFVYLRAKQIAVNVAMEICENQNDMRTEAVRELGKIVENAYIKMRDNLAIRDKLNRDLKLKKFVNDIVSEDAT